MTQVIEGWYYLHENKELIYKPGSDAITDIRDSDFCHTAWAWFNDRLNAWNILVEALSLGANKERIFELAKKWGCDDEDAKTYAHFQGFILEMDGDTFCAKRKDFENLQESPAGFGITALEAAADLCKVLGYHGGKIWIKTFSDLLK